MPDQIVIALDAMGGDSGPSVVVPSATHTIDRHPNLRLILVGDEPTIKEKLQQVPKTYDASRIEVQHASEQVEMDESPSAALRKKKDSSMRVAINLVKEGRAQACVSAGNTGALMAIARFVLKMLPGLDRPAIIAQLPCKNGHTHMLDLGANVDSSAEHLAEFAVMGSVLAHAVDNIEQPKVGLLNIGEEEIKGNERVKQAARLLSESKLNYIGYVEGDGIYQCHADVVVCDGFVGNIALKSSEGIAKLISSTLREEFKQNILTKLAGLIAYPVLRSFSRRFDPRRYNGASLLGLQGIVIKSHGGADKLAFRYAIEIAMLEVSNNVPERINNGIENMLGRQAEL
ncbi:MAG: phosphate acyltransferase PlsX [Gammaproteobacteria bacterium]|nr:MAG: phosphate acyltransferase PlsX [Gammaproteobacteria bacterium]